MKLTGENRQLGEKPVPVPHCPPQTPHRLTRDRTRASAVRGRRQQNYTSTGHTQKNGAVLIVFTIKTAPLFCVCPVY
jgi:hypothetical protein